MLKTNLKFPDKKFGAKTKYLLWRITISVLVLVILPSIWPRNYATITERDQILRAQRKPNILWHEKRSKYLFWTRTIVFVIVPSIRPKNFVTVIERAQVLHAQNQSNILWKEIRRES